ncbi:MAG: metal-dependent hydrolase [Candidatus Thermoplasmatota archaeon]|nr:metal-dependent hydrolase [Candidatus Thermoplasmatota archaeon]
MMPLGHIGIPLVPFLMMKDNVFDRRFLFFVVLGGLLPDIMDKPLGHLVLPENNGRIFAHTLLFALVVLMAALAYRPFMPFSLGVSTHLLLDGVWFDPQGSLWPLMGPFRSTDFDVANWLHAFTEPYTIAEELFGLAVIILVARRFFLGSGSSRTSA